METIEIIKTLCEKNNISITQLEKELGYGNGSLQKSKTIKSDRLMEIARRFNVTMEYLMTGEETVHIVDEEAKLLAEEIKDRPELKVLLDVSRRATKEDIEQIAAIIKRMTN